MVKAQHKHFKNLRSSSPWTCLHHMVILRILSLQNSYVFFIIIILCIFCSFLLLILMAHKSTHIVYTTKTILINYPILIIIRMGRFEVYSD